MGPQRSRSQSPPKVHQKVEKKEDPRVLSQNMWLKGWSWSVQTFEEKEEPTET